MIIDLISAAQKEDWVEGRRVLFNHWVNVCPKLFTPNPDQPWDNSLHNEKAINEELFTPLASTFCVDSENQESSLAVLNKLAGTDPQRSAGQICGHVFRNGELTYTCRDCAQDSTCVMCLNCFESSIHKNHKYKMHSSSGSGYCDCGDKDAWTDGYACDNHMNREKPQDVLPEKLLTRVRKLTEMILHYCIALVTHENEMELPHIIETIRRETGTEIPPASQYLTVLYNDETHTYENVIRVLELFIHCTKDQAMLVATIVDREGRSAVKLGQKADCTRAKDDVQRRTQRDLNQQFRRETDRNQPLMVKVMDTVLFAHQNHAIALLTWLNSQMEVFPPLREIVGDVLLTSKVPSHVEMIVDRPVESPDSTVDMSDREEDETMDVDSDEDVVVHNRTLLEEVLLMDTKMWKAARCLVHQMLMRTVFMNYDQKVAFSKAFIQHFEEIYQNFVADDHDMDVSVVGLNVQFLTVPTLARRLVAEDDALSVLAETIMKLTKKYIKADASIKRFDFTGRSFPNELRRSLQICRDMAYMLNAIPSAADWTIQLRENFLRGCSCLIDLLHCLHGMDEVKRQSLEHQVWESEWETAFNILLRLKDALSLIVAWANTDEEVHHRLLLMCLEASSRHEITNTAENGETHVEVALEDQKTLLRSFDVLKGGVSIHLPIVRLISALFTSPQYLRFFHSSEHDSIQRQIVQKVKSSGKDFYELSLRVLVLCAQTNAQLWRRNGFSLVNQIHNYFSPLCRSEMFDRDVLMLQLGAAITKPNDFLLHILTRYRVLSWAEKNFDARHSAMGKMDTEDLSKITVSLVEECLHMLILVIGERYLPGVGSGTLMDMLKREVVHVLCTNSQTFSHIQHKMSHDVITDKLSLHDAVNGVADFRKPLATSAGQFHLKEELLTQYNPFFYHYSKSDQSQAEQYQYRIRSKMSKAIKACAPPVAPPFTDFFSPIVELLRTPILINIIHLVLSETEKRNRFSSDRLFHKALFLVGMGLNEEERDPSFGFTKTAEETCGLLALMEALQGKPESAICHVYLETLVERYKALRTAQAPKSCKNVKESETEKQETAEEARAKRAARAAQMRKNAMSKMANMQNKFLKQMEDDEKTSKKSDDGVSASCETASARVEFDGKNEYDEDIVRQVPSANNQFPVCIGPNKFLTEVVAERKVTCILCQEDEPLHPTNGKPMVCAAFIQQSQLFTHKRANGELVTSSTGGISTKDLLTAPATLRYGIDVSTCSHTMHFDCYKSLAETIKSRENLRARQQNVHNQKMVDPDGGEYQCPLCKRLSNAAMPLLPAFQLMSTHGFSTVSGATNEAFEDWVSRVKRNLDVPYAVEAVRKKGHSRKRSHSERSLLDLEKQAAVQLEKAKDDEASVVAGVLALGSSSVLPEGSSLESSLSSSVPSSSVMSELMNTIRADLNTNVESAAEDFYNELAMIWNQDSAVTSPVKTPETTPVGGSEAATPRSETAGEGLKKPRSAQIHHALFTLLRPIPNLITSNKLCGNGLEQYEESMKELGKNMIKFRRRGSETKTRFLEKYLRGYVIATVTWQSTAHVARAIASYLHYDGKPLFGALNTRQRDCMSAMARLCAALSHNMQFLPNAVADMMRILCCEPPKMKMPPISVQSPLSPSAHHINSPTHLRPSAHLPSSSSPSSSAASQTPQQPSNFAFIVQLFSPAGTRKHANTNILQVDILSLAVSLMMSIGWTWINGTQSLHASASQKTRYLAPDGSVDEAHVLRLSLLAQYFQIIATYNEVEGEEDKSEDKTSVDAATQQRIAHLFSLVRPDEPSPRRIQSLCKRLEDGAQILLRPIALIYHFLTLVDPPEALKDPSIDSSEALFRYLNLPSKMGEQISGSLVENLFSMWSSAIPRDVQSRLDLVVQPVRPNLLVDLPYKYSELINQVSTFRCPSIPIEESTSNVPTICLVCGQVLCSQAYCCHKVINKETYGACRYHMSQCSGSVGIFLRVRDCNMVMMTTRKRGCFRPAPYVDEFGEVDQGFRRGNPLHLNMELYQKMKQLWLQQGITEEVVNYNEIDFRNVQFDWAHF